MKSPISNVVQSQGSRQGYLIYTVQYRCHVSGYTLHSTRQQHLRPRVDFCKEVFGSHPSCDCCCCVVQNSSMPDAMPDPSDSLEALVAILSPLFEERCYKSGAYLAREGQAADSLIYIEEGEADICFSMRQRPDEDLLDDGEEVSLILPPDRLQMRKCRTAPSSLCSMCCGFHKYGHAEEVQRALSVRDGVSIQLHPSSGGSFACSRPLITSCRQQVWQDM